MEKKGSVIGGVLLITGSCVGAGMLGLPILTGLVGFFPSIVLFTIACFFMTATGLLIVEANQWFDGRSNFITMVSKLLGPIGQITCWILYLFLFYALLVAYIALSGVHLSTILGGINLVIPRWFGSTLFVIIFGWFVYLGTRSVDLLNRVLMFGKILAYLGLIAIGFHFVKPDYLEYTNIQYCVFALPILIVSFGFQNMIPTLSHYLGGDIKRTKQAIIGGSLFTLTIYIFWQVIALGALPVDGEYGILWSYKSGVDAAAALKNYIESAWLDSFAATLAFFAILTSFLAQTMTLVHFLGDGLKLKTGKRESVGLCLLALIPPLVFAISYPDVFFKALNFAGGICAVIIFGIFPVLMIWRGRYLQNQISTYKVRGGKPILLFLFTVAVFIVFYQITTMMNFNLFPIP